MKRFFIAQFERAAKIRKITVYRFLIVYDQIFRGEGVVDGEGVAVKDA